MTHDPSARPTDDLSAAAPEAGAGDISLVPIAEPVAVDTGTPATGTAGSAETPQADESSLTNPDVDESTADDLESSILQPIDSRLKSNSGATRSRWRLLAKQKLGRVFKKRTRTVSAVPAETSDSRPGRRSLGSRLVAFVAAHQLLTASTLAGGVAIGLFANGFLSSGTTTPDTAEENRTLSFDDVQVLPPEKPAPRKTTNIPEFEQAQPIRTAELEAGPRIGDASFSDGPSFSGPAFGPKSSRPQGRGAWLTGKIEDVSGHPGNIRQIGHVDLPPSHSPSGR